MTPVVSSVTADFQPTARGPGELPDAAGSGTFSVGLTTPGRAVPCAAVQAPTQRIACIDMARGLFLVLMASCHAMTLAGIPATSALARWGLPRGWASTGLTMLCGFMVAMFCREMVDRALVRARVWRRAKQLLAVMFASNIFMVTVRHLVSHESTPLFTLGWWWHVLVPGTESSLSGILLAIAFFLLISPALIRVRDACPSRLQAFILFAVVAFITGSAWSVRTFADGSLVRHRVLDVMFGSGLGGFPVVPIVASGALGFLVGTLWQPRRDRLGARMCLAVGVFVIAAGPLASAVPAKVTPMLTRTVVDVSHFLLIITLALALTQWRISRRAFGFVSALGRCSLLTFLVHRIFEQTLNLSLQPLHVPRELVYAVCVSGGVFGSVAVIGLRRRSAGFDRALRAMYL